MLKLRGGDKGGQEGKHVGGGEREVQYTRQAFPSRKVRESEPAMQEVTKKGLE